MPIRHHIIRILSSFFYVGYLPFVPGTFGSLAGLILYFLVYRSAHIYFLFVMLLLFIGLLVAGKAESVWNKKDSRYIVIDEVTGMLIALSFVPPDIFLLTIGFFLFRLFDAFKPFPINRIETLKGGYGVMGDDLVAGIYTNLVLHSGIIAASFITS